MARITEKEMYTNILAVLTDEAQIAFIEKKIDQCVKKAETASKRKSKSVDANNAVREAMLAAMPVGEELTIKEICAIVPELNGASSNRVSGLLRPLYIAEPPTVERIQNGKGTKFKKL